MRGGVLVLCAGERKKGVLEERESEARLLVLLFFSLYIPARAVCFALAFSLL